MALKRSSMIDRRVQILDGAADQQPITTVSALRDVAHLVLLGEPGIGKTTVIETEAAVAGTNAIKVRELINETVEAPAGTLFLDALDEYRMGATDLGRVDELVKAIRRCGAPRWRLTCRAEDWKKAADIAAVKRSTAGAPVTVAQLLPLDVTEQLAVLSALGVADPNAFVDKAHTLGAAGLLESPLSLKLLHQSVIGGGPWPTTRFELFDRATFALAHEDNDTHRLDHTRATAETILGAAAKACLVLLASGGRFLWRSAALPPGGDIRAYLPAAAIGFDPSLVSDTLGSSLFRGEGEAFEPVHRTIAEFLAGRALARAVQGSPSEAALPLGRALALITGSDGRAPSDLRGLYAWFAAHLAGFGEAADARQLIEADAVSTLVYGDAAAFDTAAKRAILTNLDRHDPYFRASEVGVTAVGGLASEELADDLRQAIEVGDGTHRMMTVYEVLAAGRPVASLMPTLRMITLDPARPEWQRTRAMAAWLNGQADPAAARRALLDAMAGETPSGARESMRAELLAGMPAAAVSDEDIRSVVAAFATAPSDSTVMRLFGLRMAIETAPRPSLFDAPLTWLPSESSRRQSIDIENFLDHALAAAIKANPDVGADRLWMWLTNAREDRLSGLGDATRPALKAWLDAAPERSLALFEAVLGSDDPAEGPWMIGTYYSFIAGQPDGMMLDRLTTLAGAAAGDRRRRLLAIAVEIGRRYPVGEAAYWRLHAYLDGLPRGARRLLAALSTIEVETWRRRQARSTIRNSQAAVTQREKDLATLRRLAPSMAVGGNTQALKWAAQHYFHPRDKKEEAQTPLERITAVTDAPVLDAILSGWRHHATNDVAGVTPTTLGEVEAERTEFYSEYAAIAGLHRLLAEAAAVDPASLPLTLAIIVLRTGWIAHGSDARDELDAWAWSRLNLDTAAGSAALLAYWEAILAKGYVDSNAWHKLGVTEGGDAARGALSQLLGRHPRMFAKILRPVLAAAGTLLDRAHIESLAAAALADTDLSPEQRAIWSLAAFATDSVNQRDRLAGHGDELLSLFDGPSGSAFLDAFERGSDDEQVALAAGVFSVLAPSAAPYVELKSGRVRPEYRLSEAANGMLKRLGGLAVPAATSALEALRAQVVSFPAWEAALRHVAEQQARTRRDREYLPPPPAAVMAVLAGKAPINAADLRAILTAELRRYGRELRTGANSPWRDYWNTDKYEKPTEPKVENVARDITLNRLQDRLAKYQIAITGAEARRADGTRADVLVVSGAGRNLPIEAKRHYHGDLWTAASGQLQGYAADEGADGYGILLVFWYGDIEAPPARPDAVVPVSAGELEALLISDLSPELRATTDVVVLDVSAPERAKPKAKKAAQLANSITKAPAKRVKSTSPSNAAPVGRGRAPRGTKA